VLIAHPDISLVLKNSKLGGLSQVAARDTELSSSLGRDLNGQEVFSAHAPIPTLNWSVFVEAPRSETFEALYASIMRTALLLVAGLLVSVVASFSSPTFVRPFETHRTHIGAGQLDRDRSQDRQKPGRAVQRHGSPAQGVLRGAERKVEERTSELTGTLAQQTATADIPKSSTVR
jgi:hypothetical protein